jgi:hypothetical protein
MLHIRIEEGKMKRGWKYVLTKKKILRKESTWKIQARMGD